MFVLGFNLRMKVQLNGFSLSFVFLPQSFPPPPPPRSRCFLALYKLARMHLDLTFRGLRLDFLDTCPIKTLLKGFYNKIWAVMDTIYGYFSIDAASYVVVVHLMQRGWLSYPSFFFSSLFSTKLPLSPQGLHYAPFIPDSWPFQG